MEPFDGEENNLSAFIVAGEALEELRSINPELAEKLVDELQIAASGVESNILLVGTDGEYTVTILHVDPAVIGDNEDLVIFPSAYEFGIVAAISREVLEERVSQCEALDGQGEAGLAERLWEEFMDELMHDSIAKYKENPKKF